MSSEPREGVEQDVDYTEDELPEHLPALGDAALVPPPKPDRSIMASDEALERLAELADESVRVQRVDEHVRGERPFRRVGARDYEAVLERAGGDLALFSWESAGGHIYGWRGDILDTPRPFDVWIWNQFANMRGDPPVSVDAMYRRELREEMEHADPMVLMREDTAMPPLDEYDCEYYQPQ